MASRMNKYYDEETQLPSRQAKNMELYREINTTDIEDFNLNSNVSILDDNTTNTKSIDIQKVREILKKRYEEEPKDKKIADYEMDSYTGLNLDETRDYDINSILERAKEKKEVNYEVDRLKKIRNTQFDILSSLDLESKKEEESEPETLKDDQAKLMELINTITSKEHEKDEEDIDPLDILTDLKGNDNTVVVPAVKDIDEEQLDEDDDFDNDDTEEEKVKTKEFIKQPEVKEEKKEDKEEDKDDSFVSKSLIFTQSDFEDFDDLKEDNKSSGIVVKILTIVVIIILLFGIVFMLNGIFDWGLFWK